MNQPEASRKGPQTPGSRHALELGSQDQSSPQFRALHSLHEVFARTLETQLSAFLQTEIPTRLGEIRGITAGDYWATLHSPDCLIALKLLPRTESMVLRFDCSTVITLLELLLGGAGESAAEPRELTEIEWSLLEEIVRVLARCLGEAWRTVVNVEFEVVSLGNDPMRVPAPEPLLPMVRVGFDVELRGHTGSFEICVPHSFFEAVLPSASTQPAAPSAGPPDADVQRNLGLIENSVVELEVSLRGPKLEFKELANLQPGQVLIFDYPLGQPVSASANGAVELKGHIVSAGRKRAFQVAGLP
jgi:flagellar motor switch protein FliM